MGNYNVERLNSIKRIMKQRKDNLALKEILNYMEDYPDDVYSKYQYGIIQKRLGNIEEAFNTFADVYEADQANKYSALFEMGKIKEIEREYDYARFYFEKILKESPNPESFVSIELSKIERRLGNIDRAEEILREALKISSKETKKYVSLEYAKLELLKKRKSVAQKIIEEIPESELNGKFRRKVLCIKGKIEIEYYNYNQALKYFEEVLEGEKDNVYWNSILEIAKIYEKQGRLNDSYEMCKRLKNNLNSFMGDVDLLLGKLYQRKGDYETAKKCYLEAEKNRGTFIEKETQFRLGILEKERLNLEEAKKNLKKAASTKNLYAAPAYLNLIFIAIREADYKTCYELLDKLKELELNASMHRSINKIKVYLAHVTNEAIDHDKTLSYSEEQIINYSEEKALEHIIERHNSEQKEGFNSNIDIPTLFYGLEELLKDVKADIGDVMDYYVIDYPNAGTYNGEVVHKIRVSCLPNTKKIITFYPYHRDIDVSLEDLPSKAEEPTKKVIKRMSQVEKFNARYNKKSN